MPVTGSGSDNVDKVKQTQCYAPGCVDGRMMVLKELFSTEDVDEASDEVIYIS